MSNPSENALRSIGHVAHLTGKETWRKWKSDMKLVLELHGSWKYVNGDIPIPTDEAKLKDVEPLLRVAAYCIAMSCNDTNCDAIEGQENAKDKFEALKKLYEGDTPAQRMTLRRQLYRVEHDATRPVMDFINSVRNIVNELKAINHAPKPDEIRDIILMNLDPTFEIIQTMLAAQDKNNGEEWTIESLGERLTAFENNRLASSGSTNIELAHAVRSGGRASHFTGRGIRRSPSGDNWGNVKNLDGACNRCGREGHFARHCFRDMPEHIKERIRCMPQESANIVEEFAGGVTAGSNSHSDSDLNIDGLYSIVSSGHTIVLYPNIGYAYAGDDIVKKIHYAWYRGGNRFYAEDFRTKAIFTHNADISGPHT